MVSDWIIISAMLVLCGIVVLLLRSVQTDDGASGPAKRSGSESGK